MGLEARCPCRWNDGSGEVRALLEARELIVRGDLKRTIPIAAITLVRVKGGELCLRVGTEEVVLGLGAARAERWAKKLAALPRTLAQKLGVGPSSKALVIGTAEDPALREALADGEASRAEDAHLSVAVISNTATLQHALQVHATLPRGAPIWVVHGKGALAAFGEAPVRRIMRAAGYKDTKVSAVSDTLSATRYSRR
jgi:hypothetical protein